MFNFANQNDCIMVCLYCYQSKPAEVFWEIKREHMHQSNQHTANHQEKTSKLYQAGKNRHQRDRLLLLNHRPMGLIVKKTMVENHGNQKRNCEVQL